jgi:hypothetical protein
MTQNYPEYSDHDLLFISEVTDDDIDDNKSDGWFVDYDPNTDTMYTWFMPEGCGICALTQKDIESL